MCMVKLAERMLNSEGSEVLKGEPGYFYDLSVLQKVEATRQAVLSWQDAHRLELGYGPDDTHDRIVGPDTWYYMGLAVPDSPLFI